jgi:hypothetical protein
MVKNVENITSAAISRLKYMLDVPYLRIFIHGCNSLIATVGSVCVRVCL